MKSLLTIFLSLTLLSATSQTSVYHPFPDSAAYWTVDTWSCCWATCPEPPIGNPVIVDSHFSYFIQGDTMINNISYHKIYKTPVLTHEHCAIGGTLNNWNTYPGEYACALRDDIGAKKVFVVYPSGQQEYLRYDFNLSMGDTFEFAIVSVIDSILIGSNYRKQFNFQGSQFTIIEGIGSTAGLMEPLFPFESGGHLLCYSQNNQTLFPDTTMQCIMADQVIESGKTSFVSVFPNPFTTSSTVQAGDDFLNCDLIIYNVIGEKISAVKMSEHLTLLERKNLRSGLYFYKAISRNGKTAFGKLIVK